MMKKRNDEGFALAYVVVVIFILCSIAIALMSSTLRTLQAQENMVQRMKDKYEAMGEIERLVAELEAEFDEIDLESLSDSAFETEVACSVAAHNYYKSLLVDYPWALNSDGEYILDITQHTDRVLVSAEIQINPEIIIEEYEHSYTESYYDATTGQTTVLEFSEVRWEYKISLPVPTFISYSISSAGGDT